MLKTICDSYKYVSIITLSHPVELQGNISRCFVRWNMQGQWPTGPQSHLPQLPFSGVFGQGGQIPSKYEGREW